MQAGSGQVVLERYGMTETVMLVSNPYDGERRPGTVGFPLPGVSLRLAAARGRDGRDPGTGAQRDPVLPGRSGGHGGGVHDGRLVPHRRPRAARRRRLSADQRPGKELIITGGYNVYPREVEEVLRAHPGVADAAVVGVPSPAVGRDRGRVRGAGVGLVEGLVSELDAWCADHLVAYKRPREWRIVDAIPRNALGKILRHQLRP